MVHSFNLLKTGNIQKNYIFTFDLRPYTKKYLKKSK